MQPPLHVIDSAESIDHVFADLTAGSPAVVVSQAGRPAGMLTRSDLLEYLADRRNGV
jgi:predicted transcriptional regulator